MIGAAEQVPIYVVAASNSVAMHGTGVDFSSVFATAVLHRAGVGAAAPAAAPKPRKR